MHTSGITIEQARALDAVARAGTFAAAAAHLGRGHTAVLYLIRGLEDVLGFPVLDRSQYRSRLSPQGERVLAACRELLAADAELASTIEVLRAGWEPSLRVVFDGIVPIEPLLAAIDALVTERVPTRIEVRAEFLAGVEQAFGRGDADLMIAVLPLGQPDLVAVDLPRFDASLVARADHPLARGRHGVRALREHLLLTVRGSDPRLELPTAGIEPTSTVSLHDFASKRAAICAGIGYGWLPDLPIQGDLARGRLRRIRWTGRSRHRFTPRLYHRGPLGPAARRLVASLVKP